MLPSLWKTIRQIASRTSKFVKNALSNDAPDFDSRLKSALKDHLHDAGDIDIVSYTEGAKEAKDFDRGFDYIDKDLLNGGKRVVSFERPTITERKAGYLPDVADAVMPAFMGISEANLYSMKDSNPTTEVGKRIKLESLVRDCGMPSNPQSEVFQKCKTASALVGTRDFCRDWFWDHDDRYSGSKNGLSDESLDLMARNMAKKWWPSALTDSNAPSSVLSEKPFIKEIDDSAANTLLHDSISGLPGIANPVSTYLSKYAPNEFVDAWKSASTEGDRLKLECAAITCIAQSADAPRFYGCKNMTMDRLEGIDLTLSNGQHPFELTGMLEKDGTSKLAPGFIFTSRFDRKESEFMRREDVEQRLWEQLQNGLVLDYDTSNANSRNVIGSVDKEGCHFLNNDIWEISRDGGTYADHTSYGVRDILNDCIRGNVNLNSVQNHRMKVADSVMEYVTKERELRGRSFISTPVVDNSYQYDTKPVEFG